MSKDLKETNSDWDGSALELMFLAMAFGGWGRCSNAEISEMKERIARLEGQISMIGGRDI